MADAKGKFTIWYLREGTRDRDRYEHGITAGSREDLMAKAQAKCPRGYFVRSIGWQRNGTHNIWYHLTDKPAGECWDEKICKRAFGE